MKSIVLAAALVAALAAPAMAASNNVTHNVRHEQQFKGANASMTRDPIGVFADGKEIGRDPDANVRTEIQREYYTQQGN